MLRKIWVIAYKDLYITFTDRNLILIMIVTPLALASIIGLAFGGFIGGGGSDVPVQNIPVAVVNLDQGVEFGGSPLNQGQTFVDLLVPQGDPDPENVLHQLTNAVELGTAETARAGVNAGDYSAAIIIPAEFTASITTTQAQTALTPVQIEVYASPAAPVSANIIRSIVESFSNQIAMGSITVASTIGALTERATANPLFGLQFAAAAGGDGFNPDFSAAFSPDAALIRIEQQRVTGETAAFNPLVSFGSAQAVFFMMFTAMAGANNVMEERRAWTLQRQLVTPTPRMVLLLGKMVGTFISCVAQVIILILALTLVGSLIAGELQFIWGTNLFLLALVILCVSLAASGVAALVAGLVRTPEQGNTIGSIISILFGLFSGAFFSVEAVPGANVISRLTVNYWGVEAFNKLSQDQTDIGLNLVVLLILGVVFFSAGLFIFNRRLSV
ncbi:MAG: ABC transporter permease [Anaerolineae bacterium]|nr:ABC transporter permease [Anaerolineae bacterium]NUQ05500.1 ABC transporter permease [Anaerolineae bacterium]